MIIPFGAWTPDQPSLGNTALTAQNVLPALKSYRPVSNLAAYASSALNARCQGAAAFADRDGNISLFFGTASKLYRITAGSTAPVDISKVGGYTTAADERWTFCQFNNYIIATNFADAPQLFDLTSSTLFEDLITSGMTSIKARYCASNDKGFVFFLNTTDGTDGARPNRIWWCKQGDPRTWPTPGTAAAIAAQSDFQDLTGDYGWGMGLATGLSGGDVAAFLERALIRGIYVGGDLIFQFDAVEGARGTPAAGSLAQIGGVVSYLGEDGFYDFNGIQATPIGAEIVDKWFFADTTYGLDQNYFHRVSAIQDPINKVTLWAYPTVSGSGGTCDAIIARGWFVGKWTHIPGIDDVEILFAALAPGYSIDSLDTLSGGSIDALAYSLDSRQLTGGARLIGAFDTTHTLKTFTGDALAAVIDTGEVQPVDGQRAMILGSRPIVEGTSVTPTVTALYRDLQSEAVTTGSAVAMNASGWCPMRYSGRYHRHRLTIPAASTWSHASGVEVEPDWVKALGRR